MPNDLEKAKSYAELIRYSGDTKHDGSLGNLSPGRQVRDALYKSGLLITKHITPSLDCSLRRVFDCLELPYQCAEAFVYSSPDIQAECFASSVHECTIRFSSSLINLLSEEELTFVAGHELGHFLLEHGIARGESSTNSVEYFVQQRAQEISADRIGLLACENIQVAIRALMKIISGLGDSHLRFNVGQFISQLSHVQTSAGNDNLIDTHPSIIVRSRSLLWFSMGDTLTKFPDGLPREDIDVLDKRVSTELHKYVDSSAKAVIEQSKKNLAMWLAAGYCFEDGRFDKKEQKAFAEMFNEELLHKMINFISDLNVNEVRDIIHKRIESAKSDLESIIPGAFESECQKIKNSVDAFFSK